MGIASMVIGIVSLLIGFVPFCGTWAIIPAFAGLGLGIADVIVRSKRGQSKGMAIAGLVLNPLAIMIVIIWWAGMVSAAGAAANLDDSNVQKDLQQQMDQLLKSTQNLPGAQTPPPTVPMPGSAQPSQMEPMEPMQPAAPAPAQPAGAASPAEQPPAR